MAFSMRVERDGAVFRLRIDGATVAVARESAAPGRRMDRVRRDYRMVT
jgi:hypothetical protein